MPPGEGFTFLLDLFAAPVRDDCSSEKKTLHFLPHNSSSAASVLAAEIKNHRQMLRLSQRDLAERSGVSRPAISRVEQAGIGQWKTLTAILSVLGLRIAGIDRLSQIRLRRRLTVPEAAERAGLSAPTVRTIERNGRGRLETIEAYARSLRVRLRLVPAKSRYFSPEGAALANTKDEWYTPPELLKTLLDALGLVQFDLDPSSPGADLSPVPAARHLTKTDDGLVMSWGEPGDAVYCNPPFSMVDEFTARCAAEAVRGLRVVALVAARTGPRWLRENIVRGGADVIFLANRLCFGGPEGPGTEPAPFDVALAVWGWPDAVTRLVEAFPGAWVLPADANRVAA